MRVLQVRGEKRGLWVEEGLRGCRNWSVFGFSNLVYGRFFGTSLLED